MSCSDYVPPLIEQLHGPDPTAGSDCAIACAAMAIRFATCEKVNPSIDKVREMAGLDEPDPPPDDYSTTMAEYKKALNAFDDRAREAGFPDGITLTLPVGTHFQFRSSGSEPLAAIGVTMPPWPGDGEAFEVEGKWLPTVERNK